MRPTKRKNQASGMQGGNAPVSQPAPQPIDWERRREYMDLRKVYMAGEQQAYDDFDKAMLTLAGGAFGLSVLFVQQFAPNPIMTWLLFTAWCCFIISLLATMISFMTSQKAFRKSIDNLDRIYSFNESEDIKHASNDVIDDDPNDVMTERLNIASIIFFIIGSIFLATFAYYNIP